MTNSRTLTNVFGVIGCPVGHSMSPAIQNQAFRSEHIDASYHAFHVEKKDLQNAVTGIKALGVKGFNVTIPHKEALIPLLDEIESTAKAIGAVNTVVNEGGKLIGYNTDGKGFISSLRPYLSASLHDSRILIIGAGGAARAIYFSLAAYGAGEIDLCNRTVLKAEKLIEECPVKAKSRALSLQNAEKELNNYDIIVQTTSIGMHPHVEAKPLSLENIKSSAIVTDIIYNPIKTAFLKEAEEKGCKILDGTGMFVHQAALAFEHWTGLFPDVKEMHDIVMKKLGGTLC
ncbi:shikimate dehydrogenase [Metabacillus sp. RGM 3146]|uniref:shikimate dehydrogenase n=1 Tax=Metabacillus sp. RGM 3146 TaxID=3401092 RepID=UPI003B995E4E